MILWEEGALYDRKRIFEFLSDFDIEVALRTDEIISTQVDKLSKQPALGIQQEGIRGRLLIIPEISMIVSYWVEISVVHVMRILHQHKKFPAN